MDKSIARQQLGLPLNKKILLFTANNGMENPWKGGSFLADALAQIAGYEDILFLNVGGVYSTEKPDNWKDVPYITEETMMALYYSAADIFIYPSIADNCPLVVMEALACGTPVISFKTGGIPELVDHMQTGYIAQYRDVDDFVKGIITFIQDTELRSKSATAAAHIAREKFTFSRMINDYVKLYKELLSKQHSK